MTFLAGLFLGFAIGFLFAAVLVTGGRPRGGDQPDARRGGGHTPPFGNPPPRAP